MISINNVREKCQFCLSTENCECNASSIAAYGERRQKRDLAFKLSDMTTKQYVELDWLQHNNDIAFHIFYIILNHCSRSKNVKELTPFHKLMPHASDYAPFRNKFTVSDCEIIENQILNLDFRKQD